MNLFRVKRALRKLELEVKVLSQRERIMQLSSLTEPRGVLCVTRLSKLPTKQQQKRKNEDKNKSFKQFYKCIIDIFSLMHNM